MKKFDSYDKKRLRTLCVNVLLYVFPPGGGYIRPSGLRFKRTGEVWGYDAGNGWRCLSGSKASGPGSSARWEV